MSNNFLLYTPNTLYTLATEQDVYSKHSFKIKYNYPLTISNNYVTLSNTLISINNYVTLTITLANPVLSNSDKKYYFNYIPFSSNIEFTLSGNTNYYNKNYIISNSNVSSNSFVFNNVHQYFGGCGEIRKLKIMTNINYNNFNGKLLLYKTQIPNTLDGSLLNSFYQDRYNKIGEIEFTLNNSEETFILPIPLFYKCETNSSNIQGVLINNSANSTLYANQSFYLSLAGIQY